MKAKTVQVSAEIIQDRKALRIAFGFGILPIYKQLKIQGIDAAEEDWQDIEEMVTSVLCLVNAEIMDATAYGSAVRKIWNKISARVSLPLEAPTVMFLEKPPTMRMKENVVSD